MTLAYNFVVHTNKNCKRILNRQLKRFELTGRDTFGEKR